MSRDVFRFPRAEKPHVAEKVNPEEVSPPPHHDAPGGRAHSAFEGLINSDIIFAIVLFLMAATNFIVGPGWGSTAWFFPNLLASAMLAAGLTLVVRGVFRPRRERLFESSLHMLDALWFAATVCAYVALLSIAGYVVSTLLFYLVLLLALSSGTWRRRLVIAVLGSLVATTALVLVFGFAFNVPLPSGV